MANGTRESVGPLARWRRDPRASDLRRLLVVRRRPGSESLTLGSLHNVRGRKRFFDGDLPVGYGVVGSGIAPVEFPTPLRVGDGGTITLGTAIRGVIQLRRRLAASTVARLGSTAGGERELQDEAIDVLDLCDRVASRLDRLEAFALDRRLVHERSVVVANALRIADQCQYR